MTKPTSDRISVENRLTRLEVGQRVTALLVVVFGVVDKPWAVAAWKLIFGG